MWNVLCSIREGAGGLSSMCSFLFLFLYFGGGGVGSRCCVMIKMGVRHFANECKTCGILSHIHYNILSEK